MPFTVTPVDKVVISFDNVELGDRLAITLDNNEHTQIILTAVEASYVRRGYDKPDPVLGLMPEHIPSQAYSAMHEAAAKILRYNPRDLETWFQKLELATDPYNELLSAILDDKPTSVYDVQVGEVPTLSFGTPFSLDHHLREQLTWKPAAPIKQIKPATEWDAALAAGRIQAERELHALRVR